ncbi:MAG: helix-turn-helix transcriptional regulator [Chamaesiphon sp. CSU_1_12]|nr:helix-turn-helix transcriptional regulator [Chamaesiphon sp. CSU_1_12]
MTEPTALILKHEWDGLQVEYGRLEAVGEFDFAMPQNGLSVAFTPQNSVTWSVDGKCQDTNLPAGSVFVYGDRQFVWHRRTKPSEYVNLQLDPALLQQLAIDNGLPANIAIEHRVIFQDPTILHVAQLLKGEVINGGIAGNLYVESLRNLLAIHLLRNHTRNIIRSTAEIDRLDGWQLKQLQDYIEENLSAELTIASLAASLPMSQFHFARAFKAATGSPPHRYIMQRRIERSKVLLSVTRLSAAEIAYQVGFANQSHFSAQFRKSVGLTPKQFRESA